MVVRPYFLTIWKMFTVFRVTIVLYFVKILSGSRNKVSLLEVNFGTELY